MMYLFKSPATGNLLVLHHDGDALLRIIGSEPAAQGILEPAALPAAIAAIEQAVSRDDLLRTPEPAPGWEDPADRTSAPGEPVTLRQRAWPMLQMMKLAHAARAEVVWGV